MPAQTIVHLTTRSGLASGLVETYRAERQHRSSDAVALLVPTQQAAEAARLLILNAGDSGLLDPRIMTFPQLAEAILVANRHPSRQLTARQRELLVADVMAELKDDRRCAYLQATHDLPGTVSAMCALLDEIKRGGIPSETFPQLIARHCPGHPANKAVAAVYARYHERLQALHLYDEPGLFWDALERLEKGERKPLEGLEILLLDGFEEFTTTQSRMLQALAGFVERIEVRLWLDPQRPTMTPRSVDTRDQLQREMDAEVRSDEAPQVPPDTDLARLRQHLFSSQDAALGDVDGSVQIMEVAGGMVGECREIARRIKLLLTGADAPPAQGLAIFLRSWDSGYDATLRQSLDWYGVPADLAQGPTLASVPAVQAALDVLDLVVGGWLRQDVIKLLNSSYVHTIAGCADPPSARRLEQLALAAGIIGGAAQGAPGVTAWQQGLTRLATRLQDQLLQRRRLDRALPADSEEFQQPAEDDDGNRLPPAASLARARGRVERAQQLVNALDALLRPLAQSPSLAASARAFGSIINALGIADAAGAGDSVRAALDLQGLAALADLLREIAEGPDVLGLEAGADPVLFASQVRQACATARLRGSRHRQAGVQVLDLATAGLDRYDTVVVCGLRDGSFPARRRQDVFYSDAERAALHEHLPGLRPRLGGHHDDEVLLHDALAAADRQVWLTYPLTEASGAPVLRSLYVDEVLRHWQPDRRPRLMHSRRQSEVIAGLAEACHYLEALEAVQSAHDGAAALSLTPPPGLPALAHLQSLAAMERDRAFGQPHDVFTGVLGDAAIVAALVERYGPDHIFSVSQLNSYARCPMQFFMNRVLRLEAPLEPTDDLDRRDLGTLAHRILAAFFGQRTFGHDECEPLTEEFLPQAQEALAACVREAANAWSETVFGAQPVWDKAIERLTADLQALLCHEVARNTEEKGSKRNWSPPRVVRDVEVDFGGAGEFAVPTRLPEPVKVRGRIDRVDLTALDGERYWVIWDYKSSDGVSARLVREGADLQLPLYALAVEQLYPREAVGFHLWGYYRVERPLGWPNLLVRPTKDTDEDPLVAAMHTARIKLADYVEGIREGCFPATPNELANPCRTCDFRRVCRVP